MTSSLLRPFSIAVLMLATSPAWAVDDGLALRCTKDPREPGVEARAIARLAPGKVARKSAHVLVVDAGAAPIRFVDEPPYDEQLDGVHHHFCDRRGGFILVKTEDNSLFTGTLVNEATGKATPGGEEVIFSPDRRAYFATRQPDGLDGAQWAIHAVNGDVSWEGFSFILDPHRPDTAVATLEDPRWKPGGEFTALARCSTDYDKTWPVTLRRITRDWEWSPRPRCPAAKR